VAVPVLAQTETLTQPIEVGDGFRVRVPDTWEVGRSSDDTVIVSGDGLEIYFYPPSFLEPYNFGDENDAAATLVAIYDRWFDNEIRPGDVWELGDTRFPTYYYPYSASNYSYVLVYPGGNVFYIEVYALEANLTAKDITLALDIMSSMLRGSLRRAGGNTTQGGDTTPATTSTASCTISAPNGQEVNLRVGPGTNRTSIAFLPNGEFGVVGQTSDDDGAIWYKLDKEEAAPQTAAIEIWVAAEAIIEAGDCAAVVDAFAPPIIPVIANNPPPVPAPGSTEASAAPPANNPNAGNYDPATVPTNGSYTIAWGLFANASCVFDGENVQTAFPSAELGLETFTDSLRVSSNGSSFTFDNTTFIRDSGTTYIGSTVLNERSGNLIATGVYIYLQVASPNVLQGRVAINFSYDDGVQWSASVPASLTR
jgi:hypothetical protein